MSPEYKLTGTKALLAAITLLGAAAICNHYTEPNTGNSGDQNVYASMGLSESQAKLLVERINDSLHFMKNCSSSAVQQAADIFDSLNHQSKLTNIRSSKNSDQPFSVMVSSSEDQPQPLITFNPDLLINGEIGTKAMAKSIFEAVYTYALIKDDPLKYDLDIKFKDQVKKDVTTKVKEIPCLQ